MPNPTAPRTSLCRQGRPGRFAGIAVLAALLAGCAGTQGQEGDDLSVAEVIPFVEEAPKAPKKPPRFCYRSLAEVECYTSPQPGKEGRLVGWFDSADYLSERGEGEEPVD